LPLHRSKSESPTPGNASPRSLRGETASLSRVPPAWFRTTSTVCSSPTVQVCFALLPILGFAVVSSRRETGLLPAHRLPFGAFPPPTATVPFGRPFGLPVDTVGSRHGCDHCWPTLHREPCLLALRSGHREAGLPAHVRRALARRLLGAEASRPCSIVGSVAIASVAGRGRSMLPWAWLIPLVATRATVSFRRGRTALWSPKRREAT